MTKDRLQRLTHPHRCALIALTALTVALAAAAPTLAKEPTGDFAVFNQCPVNNPAVTLCVFSQGTGGEFRIGTATVPIDKTITLQGGIILNEETGAETFVGATNGETLSKTPLTIPGGLLGIAPPERWPHWLRAIFRRLDRDASIVTATAELVGTPSVSRTNTLFAEGTALQLPVRIHLSNVLLGRRCYIGSAANPIVQNLTTGITSPPPPNTPIKGAVGELEFKDEFQFVVIKNNSLVDNAYAVPSAEGCGGFFSFLIDPAVNAKLGLPSAAGHNTAVLNGALQNATAQAVKNSEQ